MLRRRRRDPQAGIAQQPGRGVAERDQTAAPPRARMRTHEGVVAADQDGRRCRRIEDEAEGLQRFRQRCAERVAAVAGPPPRQGARRRARPARRPPSFAGRRPRSARARARAHGSDALIRALARRVGVGEQIAAGGPATPSRTAAARSIVPTRARPLARTSTTSPPYQPRGPASCAAIAASARARGVLVSITGAAVATIASQASTPSRSRPRRRSTAWTTVASVIGRRRSRRRSDPGSHSGARSLRSASLQTASEAASTSSLNSRRKASASPTGPWPRATVPQTGNDSSSRPRTTSCRSSAGDAPNTHSPSPVSSMKVAGAGFTAPSSANARAGERSPTRRRKLWLKVSETRPEVASCATACATTCA